MQQKQRNIRIERSDAFSNSGASRLVLFVIGLSFLLVAGVITLITIDIPAPQTPIEQQLDAQNFLGKK